MIRVLVADDSPTARELLTAILGSDPELSVVGQAVDGTDAVRQTAELRPNVVTMDIHMPGLDGFDAAKQIMVDTPTPIVIVSASTMVGEVAAGMRALRAGALTILKKPPGPGASDYARSARELIDTVKAMADVKVVRHFAGSQPTPPKRAAIAPVPHASGNSAARRGAIAVAASTGGPPALHQVLAALPADFILPILVVQHMAKGFTVGFAQWLNACVPLTVKVAEEGLKLEPGTIYIAPEEHHLELRNERTICLASCMPGDRFCPSANRLFQSVARVFGKSALGVILTGMGDDGVEGLQDLRQSGGRVLAQDRASSVVYGMPGAAVEAGVVDESLPLDEVARSVLNFSARSTSR